MKFILLFSLLTFFACSSRDHKVLPDNKVAELRINFEERIKAIDSTYKLDPFKLLHLDTLTQRDKYNSLYVDVVDRIKEINDIMEKTLGLYKSNMQLVNLTNGLSSSLYNTYKSDAEDSKKEFEKYQDESKSLSIQAHSLDSLSQNCDTLSAIGYEAVCLYQIRRKDQSVKKDTSYILLNLDKNIVKREDYLKLPD